VKEHRCYLCKLIDKEENLIKGEVGREKIQSKWVHPDCYNNYLDRKKFYIYLLEVLDIPATNKTTVLTVDALAKQYSWKILIHALKNKEEIIVKKFNELDNGLPYIIAIIRNQLPMSYRDIQREKMNKPKIIKESNVEEIMVRTSNDKEVIVEEIQF
jgi:hypothetical protein